MFRNRGSILREPLQKGRCIPTVLGLNFFDLKDSLKMALRVETRSRLILVMNYILSCALVG
jgi:hypothetical protein